MSAPVRGELDASGLRIGIVRSLFNQPVTDGLLRGATEVLEEAGAGDVTSIDVEGAFEVPVVAQRLVSEGCDAVVALGAVIEGETDHYEHIAGRTSEGLMRVMLDTGVPIAFGILTVTDPDHARARSASGEGNKGREAANAAIRTANLLKQTRDLRPEAM
jgi:6,7-dimethyl-8-ribityllumazine synthase